MTANRNQTYPLYPDVSVDLIGNDGNAFAILGRVQAGLREGGADEAEVQRFNDEATSGDYDHLLRTCMKWVDVQ